MIWNSDGNIVSSGKETLVLRLLGCALFGNLIYSGDLTLLLHWNHIYEDYQVVRVEGGSHGHIRGLKHELIRTYGLHYKRKVI